VLDFEPHRNTPSPCSRLSLHRRSQLYHCRMSKSALFYEDWDSLRRIIFCKELPAANQSAQPQLSTNALEKVLALPFICECPGVPTTRLVGLGVGPVICWRVPYRRSSGLMDERSCQKEGNKGEEGHCGRMVGGIRDRAGKDSGCSNQHVRMMEKVMEMAEPLRPLARLSSRRSF
jgi:hypothetical protein